MRILYAEDEPQLSMAVAEILKMEGFEVDCAPDGKLALEKLRHGFYDAAVLDIMMPEMSGIEVLKAMREADDFTPVLMLTAKAQTDDRIEGLECGADDYLGKPFVMKELIAHLKSLLRRNTVYKDTIASFSNVSLNLETGELKSERGSLRLSMREAKLLCLFFKHPGCGICAERINEVLNAEAEDKNSAGLYISYLKNKLGQINGRVEIEENSDGLWFIKEKS